MQTARSLLEGCSAKRYGTLLVPRDPLGTRDRSHRGLRRRIAGALFAALALAAAPGCGGEEPPAAKPAEKAEAAKKPATAAAAPPKKKAKAKAKKGAFEVYPRIDDKYRREFKEEDFLSDLTGEERRDPFQSFVVRQGGTARKVANTQPTIQPTDVCTEKNSRAPGFLLRDMRLIGIVLRGTNSFAQFRDKAGYGWIVKRGDCLGKEKAVVQAVGVGSVTLEVIPETPPNAPPPPPQRQDIALYPDDLEPGAAVAAGEAAQAPAPAPTTP